MAESEQEVEEIAGQIMSVFGEGRICPTSEQWRYLLLSAHDGKIGMVNFVKFRERAAYPDRTDASLSGGEAIARCAAVSQRNVSEVEGKFLFTAMVDFVLIGEQEEWDAIGIVEYPNRAAFLTLFQGSGIYRLPPSLSCGYRTTQNGCCAAIMNRSHNETVGKHRWRRNKPKTDDIFQ